MMSRKLATFVHALMTRPREGDASRWAVARAALGRVEPGKPVTFTATEYSALWRLTTAAGWSYHAALATLTHDDAPLPLAERARPVARKLSMADREGAIRQAIGAPT
jgi:hypothetical protein